MKILNIELFYLSFRYVHFIVSKNNFTTSLKNLFFNSYSNVLNWRRSWESWAWGHIYCKWSRQLELCMEMSYSHTSSSYEF